MSGVRALCDVVRQRVGIDLRETQAEGSLQRFVEARVVALNLKNTSNYLEVLEQQRTGGSELDRVIKAVTNPHTFFFRDEAQFRAVTSLISKHKQNTSRPLTIWSAGCATGEEPFSLAMICADLGVEVFVTATDVNRDVLNIAEEARFKAWSLRRCPSKYVDRYFTHEDSETYRVLDDIRRLVTFQRHNLVDEPLRPRSGAGLWDLIFCRNVLLYFYRPAAQEVLNRYAEVLSPEGWLFLSTAEHLHDLLERFQFVEVEGTFVLQHRDDKSTSGIVKSFSPSLRLAPLSKATFKLPTRRRSPITEPKGESAKQASVSPTLVTRVTAQLTPSNVAGKVPQSPDEEKRDTNTEDLYDAALSALDSGDRPRAVTLLERHIDAHPEHVLSRITLGNIHLKAHDFDDALSAYESARQRAPLLPEIHYLQGVVYRKHGDLTRAIHAFRHALFLNPKFWCAAFMLAGVYSRSGRNDRHRRNLQHTLSLLESGEEQDFFDSYVSGMQDVCIPPEEAVRLCKRFLQKP